MKDDDGAWILTSFTNRPTPAVDHFVGLTCDALFPDVDFVCTRTRGHTGRHEAGVGDLDDPRIVAYWPQPNWLDELNQDLEETL